MIVDLFAGPGGFSEACRLLGLLTEVGFELDKDACATRRAAGHRTVRADVASLAVDHLLGKVIGVLGSPPCQGLSSSGLRAGVGDIDLVIELLGLLWGGHDRRAQYAEKMADHRSILLAEPLRFALAARPEWVVLEQVPAALPVWEATAAHLGAEGYSTWTGPLNAASYGVPQTRTRAILIASRVRRVTAPAPTHYDPRRGAQLFGQPWMTMAEALGWDAAGIVNTRGQRKTAGGNEFGAAQPSWALTEKARSWVLHTNRDQRPDGSRQTRNPHVLPAPSLTGKSGGQWVLRPDLPVRDGASAETMRLSLEDAAVLQSFRRDYPWQGSRSKAFLQCGNAIPVRLAAAVIGAATGLDWQSAVEREYGRERAAA